MKEEPSRELPMRGHPHITTGKEVGRILAEATLPLAAEEVTEGTTVFLGQGVVDIKDIRASLLVVGDMEEIPVTMVLEDMEEIQKTLAMLPYPPVVEVVM